MRKPHAADVLHICRHRHGRISRFGLLRALLVTRVRRHAVIEHCPAQRRVRIGVEVEARNAAHLGLPRGRPGIVMERAYHSVLAVQAPTGWDLELHSKMAILEVVSHGRSRRGHGHRNLLGAYTEAQQGPCPGKVSSEDPLLLSSHSGIGQPIHPIGQQIHRDVGQPDGQNAPLHQSIIPIRNRRKRQPPQAWPSEDRLRHNRSCKQRAKLQSHHRQNRIQRIPQRVPVHHSVLRKSFGPRSTNVILTQLLQHRRSHHARQNRRQAQPQRHRRQHQVLQKITIHLRPRPKPAAIPARSKRPQSKSAPAQSSESSARPGSPRPPPGPATCPAAVAD